jgi:hypothetical protein
MAAITVLVFAEKTLPWGRQTARATAAALVAYGVVVLAAPQVLPTFMAGDMGMAAAATPTSTIVANPDYRFEVAEVQPVGPGKTTVAVRIAHMVDNKPVEGALILEAKTNIYGAGADHAEAPARVDVGASSLKTSAPRRHRRLRLSRGRLGPLPRAKPPATTRGRSVVFRGSPLADFNSHQRRADKWLSPSSRHCCAKRPREPATASGAACWQARGQLDHTFSVHPPTQDDTSRRI